MLTCQRHLFDIPEDVSYLNSAFMGPMLKTSRQAAIKALETKVWPWTVTPPVFFEGVEVLRSQLAQLINASAEDICINPSVSYGIGIAAANLTAEPGQSIIVLEDQFPSNIYPWMGLANRTGAHIKTVARPADTDWTSAVLQAMDRDTAICALPQVHWTDGSLVDLIQVGRRCRELGAALVVDGTQSVGVMPFNVRQIQPDFLVVALYKWLLGPYSMGFTYAAPHRQNGTPLEENWINRKDAENFAGLVEYKDDYAPGARRYDMGDKSNFLLMPVAVDATRQLLEWGVEETAQTLSCLTTQIEERARELGYQVLGSNRRGPHLTGIGFPPGVAGGLSAKLATKKVIVSVRGDAMRVSAHLFNHENDIDRLFQALAE